MHTTSIGPLLVENHGRHQASLGNVRTMEGRGQLDLQGKQGGLDSRAADRRNDPKGSPSLGPLQALRRCSLRLSWSGRG